MARERRSSAEIQAEIARTRASINGRLAELGHELAPARLVVERIEAMREVVTQNPGRVKAFFTGYQAPLALVGLGLGWLVWRLVQRTEAAGEEPPTAAIIAPDPERAAEPDGLAGLIGRHPLSAGGLFILAGAVLSQAVPPGRRESDWLGTLRGVLHDALRQDRDL